MKHARPELRPSWAFLVLIAPLALVLLTSTQRAKAEASGDEAGRAAPTASATLVHPTLPASCKGTPSSCPSTLVQVEAFGRYALTAKSEQGVALQLVDHMAGPGTQAGSPGNQDGRLDLFLDQGTYKLLAIGHEKNSGEVLLEAHPFVELNPHPVMLVEHKDVHSSLEDFQQRSWWLKIDKRRTVILEAAGRNLSDLRLWRDGDWLVDATPQCADTQPQPEKPLQNCQLSTRLEPGLYLLTAYGGLELPWGKTSSDHPLHLRYGIPLIPAADRRRHLLSHFGIDRFRVPGTASFFRIELPEAEAASLGVGTFSESNPFSTGRSSVSVSKKSNPPVAEIDNNRGGSSEKIVTVKGRAGQPYVLQHFKPGSLVRSISKGPGDFWISTVHSGSMEDSIDATALLTFRPPGSGQHTEVERSQAIDLSKLEVFQRRCNLLSPLSLLFYLEEENTVRVETRGIKAMARIEPFMTSEPRGYEAPAYKSGDSSWELTRGYHVLSLEGEKNAKGIVDIRLRTYGLMDRLQDVVWDRDSAPSPIQGSATFEKVRLEGRGQYKLWLNRQPGVRCGVIQRKLPLDLSEGLPITQRPGTTITVPFKSEEDGILRALAEDGASLELRLNGGAPAKQISVQASDKTQKVTLQVKGERTVAYSLRLEPKRLQSSEPLPPLPDSSLAARPKYPLLSATSPQFFDLERRASNTFNLLVSEPSLYQLETVGLLSTEGNLRTRVNTSFRREQANGVGRNFLIQDYLRAGDYQVTVKSQGQTAGHLGMHLAQTRMVDGGELSDGVPARIALPAGDAVVYRFRIDVPGRYRLRSLGMGRSFRCRLEDKDGWPIIRPNVTADLNRDFDVGEYRLVLLPESTDSRRVTRLERVREAITFRGHGPHPLPLSLEVNHTWMEPEEGQERTPDTWRIFVPADIDATIALSSEMQADIVRLGGTTEGQGTGSGADHESKKGRASSSRKNRNATGAQEGDSGSRADDTSDESQTKIGYVPPARGWSGKLEKGRYLLEVTCIRSNNRVPYSIRVSPRQMVQGSEREVYPPTSLELSVGSEELVELSSFGSRDVRARLFDAAGKLVAANDDRTADWNFALARRLDPGKYRLKVDPVGRSRGGTIVSMRCPGEKVRKAVQLPARLEAQGSGKINVYPLDLEPRRGDLLVIAAQSRETVGLSLEASSSSGWRTLATTHGLSLEASSSSGWRTLATTHGYAPHIELPMGDEPANHERKDQALRLRVWSLDGRGNPIQVQAALIKAPSAREGSVARGVRLKRIDAIDLPAGALRIKSEGAGLFRLSSEMSGVRSCPTPGEACKALSSRWIRSEGESLWLFAEMPEKGRREVTAERMRLELGEEQRIQVEVPNHASVQVDLKSPKSGPLVAVARATTGLVGVDIIDRKQEDSYATSSRWTRLGVGEHSTIAVALEPPRDAAAVLWRATDSGEQMEAQLHALELLTATPESLTWGQQDGVDTGLLAQAFQLPPGPKTLRMAVGPGTALLLSGPKTNDEIKPPLAPSSSDAETEDSLLWHDGEAFEASVSGVFEQLQILHLAEGRSPFSVRVLPSETPEEALTAEKPFERRFPTAGTLRIPVDMTRLEGDGFWQAHWMGAAEEVRLVSREGTVAAMRSGLGSSTQRTGVTTMRFGGSSAAASSSALDLDPSSAYFLVRHAPGLVVGWIEGAPAASAIEGKRGSGLEGARGSGLEGKRGSDAHDMRSSGLWGAQMPTPEAIDLPTAISLKGKARAYTFTVVQPQLLHIQTSAPMLLALERARGPQEVEVLAEGGARSLYLPAGEARLMLRALAKSKLSGTLELTSSPITPISEGLGPEVLLSSGSSRLFSFEIKEKGPVGIGVRADREVVDCALVDGKGQVIGEGIVQMPTLEPGRYFLSLRAPENAGLLAPIRARPALAGIAKPDTGPPADVIRNYLRMAEESP